MPGNVISTVEQVSEGWLTAVLLKSGGITQGEVTSFAVDNGRGNWSTSARLLVQYSHNALGDRPQHLFLKMVNTNLDDGESFGDSEVRYYTQDYVDVREAPLLHCYDAAYSDEDKRYHILLEDVSATHIEAAERMPSLEYGLALAEGLAALHARWWGEKGLQQADAAMHSPQHLQYFVDLSSLGLEPLLEHYSAVMKPQWLERLRTLFEQYSQTLIERSRNLSGMTIIHGDAGEKNILRPRHGERPVYIIDRQPFNWSLTVWLGVYDLAYALVLDWPTAIRRQYEMPILKHYHGCLIQHGVTDTTWERLLEDYRMCVAMCVYIVVEYFRGGVQGQWVHVWLAWLERALIAIEDLEGS
jgi:hypothetical protein